MLLDSNLILMDSSPVLGAAVTGPAVGLTSFLHPGSMEPVPVCAKVVGEDFAGGTSLTFTLTQSDSRDGPYADVPGSAITVPLAELTVGKNIGWRFLPRGARKPWLKMVATPNGTFTAGKIFGAVVREEHQPYGPGMHIDKGAVQD